MTAPRRAGGGVVPDQAPGQARGTGTGTGTPGRTGPVPGRLSVEVARPADYAAIGRVCVAAYHHARLLEPADWYAGHMREVAHRAAHAVVLAARAGREVLGTLTLAPAGTEYAEVARAGELEIRMLAVDPGAQGRGVAEALLRAAARWGRTHGHGALVLSVFSGQGAGTAHRLYERVGFRRARDYVGDWDPAATMWCYELRL